MKHIFVTLLFCLGFTASALADGRIFPPDDCSEANPFMAFNAVDGSNTYCVSGQSVLSNALPNCSSGQQVVFDGSKFVCKPASALLSPSGYQKLPSGLIMAWGSYGGPTNLQSTNPETIKTSEHWGWVQFPIAFPHGVFTFITTPTDVNDG